MSSKMWGGRFDLPADKFAEEFGAVIHIETRMCQDDIQGSIAHAKMLAHQGIISQEDGEKIVQGLGAVLEEIKSGQFTFKAEDEDIHMAIEKRLTELIGPAGGRLHTGRSRNDQCQVDGVLYFRRALRESQEWIRGLQKVLVAKAEEYMGVVMPGYTHLQTAQPILVSHWFMAYFQMLERDWERFESLYEHTSLCPLGAAALAGTGHPIDRFMTASLLGFDGPTENSLDTVANRDYVIEYAAVAAICYMHLTRLAGEIVLFSSQDFKFIELSDDYCTGSSIMPQKKNPDMAELIRGKGGRMFGNLNALLTMMKGLPLAYDKDMQEDKELSFDSIDTLNTSLKIMAPMVSKMKVIAENTLRGAQRGYANATDLADYLVKKNVPFRDAHRVTGILVNYAIHHKKALEELSIEEFQAVDPRIEKDIYENISIERCVQVRNSYGGTSPQAVRVQIDNAKKVLG